MPDESIVESGPETPEGALEQPAVEAAPVPETPEETAEGGEASNPPEDKKEEPGPVPYKRFSEVYSKAKERDEIERKFQQFRALGPEGYFKLYPDEKPKDAPAAPAATPEPLAPLQDDLGALVVTGGKFNGMTLREVYAEDPVTAANMQFTYLRNYEAKQNEVRTQQDRLRTEAEREAQSFMGARAKEAFGKDFDALNELERQQVEALADEVTTWMMSTRRGGGNIEDAFLLMKHRELLTKSKSAAVQAVLKALDPSNAVPSITRKAGGSSDHGFGKYMGMTPDQLAGEFESMSDAEQTAFLKKAPADFRKKYPSLPYA